MSRRQQTDGSLALEQKKVIVIEAAQRPEAQKLRVAAYCRVSSDYSGHLRRRWYLRHLRGETSGLPAAPFGLPQRSDRQDPGQVHLPLCAQRR